MTPTPYLFFNGNCAAALAAYEAIFNVKTAMTMKASEMPDIPVPDDRKDWIAHGELAFEGGSLMMSDNIFGTSETMTGSSVMLSYAEVARAREVFDRLAEDGEVTMAFEPTFWSAGFGAVTDRFGIRWMIGTDT
ncbi:MAG: VOC family protein [Pseudomonadota bacterium]